MQIQSRQNILSFTYLLGFLLIACVFFIVFSSSSVPNSKGLEVAILVDLVIVLPLLFILATRKTKIPKTTGIGIMIIGLLIGSIVFPPRLSALVEQTRLIVVPIVEITVLGLILTRVRKLIRETNKNSQDLDFYEALTLSSQHILPRKVAMLFATEIAVFHYGLFKWSTAPLKEGEFTYHKRSGAQSILYALLMAVAVETVVFHILLNQWSNVAAWIFTCLSIYSGLQVFGFAKSLAFRPIKAQSDGLYLRNGIMSSSHIPWDMIDRFEVSRRTIKKEEQEIKIGILGDLESHNMIIHLNQERQKTGLYGKKITYRSIAVYLDDLEGFVEKAQEFRAEA